MLYNFYLFVDVPGEFFYGTSKKILVVFWAHLVKAIWQTFRSQFHIFVGYLGINSFAEEVLKSFSGRRNVLEQPVFGFTNSLLYSLEEESRKLRVLISWVLILLSKLIALWRCSYEVPKTIFILNSFVEGHVIKKNQVWSWCLWLVSRPKSGYFFGKYASKFWNHFHAEIIP